MALDDELKNEILRSISTEGAASEEEKLFNLIIASREQGIALLERSSGLAKIKSSVLHSFKFIISQPLSLKALNPFEIRCCLCGKVIAYPAWHKSVRFNVNYIQYFVCFDKNNPAWVTSSCFKRL